MDENNIIKFDIANNKSGEYKVKTIWDSIIYAKSQN